MKRVFLTVFFLLILQIAGLRAQDNGIGDTIHVLHYNIHLDEINTEDHTITAYTEARLVPLIEYLAYIPLELKDLTVDSVFIDGTQWNFTHTGDVIRIPLTTRATRADTMLVGVYYHGQPFHEDWGGFHFSGDYAFNLGVGFVSIPHNLGKTWFPCVDDFTDRADYDLYITLENGKTGVGGGLLTEITDNGDGTTTWHWQLSHPIPTYLESAAIGEYELYEDTFEGMEGEIPINIYVRPSDTAKVAGSFVNLHEILNFFEDMFGPYPFERVGYVSTAKGAMEHATNIAYPHFAINGNTTYESLYTHELSHMWFGDKVTCSTAEDMWLNEGWATFCELFYRTAIYNEELFITLMRNKHHDVLRYAHVHDGGFWPLNNIPQNVTYGSTAYDKGATVVNTLRNYLGDSLFSEAMTAYLNNFAYQSVSSYDMRDFLTSYTGIDMDGFFENWVFTPGTPHYSLDSVLVTEGNASFMVDVFPRQKRFGYDFIGDDNIIEIAYVKGNFDFVTDTIHFSGTTGHSIKYIDFEPVTVLLDPYETVEDATIDNYRFFDQPMDYSFPKTVFKILIDQLSDSALVQVTHNLAAPDSIKVPVEGLRISPNRYWRIDGVLPEDFHAQGRFYFDAVSGLDDSLIVSENDSLVILYRDHPRHDWQYVPQMRVGNWNIGYVFVEDLQLGEYAPAVYDKTIVGTPENPKAGKVRFYPNPAKKKLNIEFPEGGRYTIRFYDSSGSLLKTLDVVGQHGTWKWSPSDITPGVIVAEVLQDGRKIATEKISVIK